MEGESPTLKYYQTQPKVLRKILEKVFINKKFTQCKTSRTLKMDVLEIPGNKNIGKLFSKYKLLFLNQANSCSVHLKYWCYHSPHLELHCLPDHLCKNFTLVNWNPYSTQYLLCSSWVSLCCPTPIRPHAVTSVGNIKPHVKPSQ